MKIQHKELVDIGARWLKNHPNNVNIRCNYIVTEFNSACSESPDIYGLRGEHSTVIEVKISKSDFKADLKKRKFSRNDWEKGIGSARFYLCPENLIILEDLPNGYGLLYFTIKGKIEMIKDSSYFKNRNWKGELLLLTSIIRRLAKRPQIFDFQESNK